MLPITFPARRSWFHQPSFSHSLPAIKEEKEEGDEEQREPLESNKKRSHSPIFEPSVKRKK